MHQQPLKNAVQLQNRLKTTCIGSEIIVLTESSSTNDLAKHYFEQGAREGLTLIADRQTQGKGRFGRVWFSDPGVGIYLSVLLKPSLHSQPFSGLTLLAGVATVRAINRFTTVKASLKWPNDILINGKKVCGILCETCGVGAEPTGAIIGIGINVNHDRQQFPDELRDTATSLKIETGAPVDRSDLIQSLLQHLDEGYLLYKKEGIAPLIGQWSEHTEIFGKSVVLNQGGRFTQGIALRLAPSGNLVIRTEDGQEVSYASGEVTLKI